MQLSVKDIDILDNWMHASETEVCRIKQMLMPGEPDLKFECLYRPSVEGWDITVRRPPYEIASIYVDDMSRTVQYCFC